MTTTRNPPLGSTPLDGAADLDDSSTVSASDSLGILRRAVAIDIQTNRCNGL